MNLWVVVEYFVHNGDFGGSGRGLLISLPKILLAESKGCACFVLQQDFIAFFLGSTILFSEWKRNFQFWLLVWLPPRWYDQFNILINMICAQSYERSKYRQSYIRATGGRYLPWTGLRRKLSLIVSVFYPVFSSSPIWNIGVDEGCQARDKTWKHDTMKQNLLYSTPNSRKSESEQGMKIGLRCQNRQPKEASSITCSEIIDFAVA